MALQVFGSSAEHWRVCVITPEWNAFGGMQNANMYLQIKKTLNICMGSCLTLMHTVQKS